MSQGISRRHFSVALVGTVTLGFSHGDEPDAKPDAMKALADLVKVRYPHLQGADLAAAVRTAQRKRLLGEFFRKVELSNGDDPATAFTAD